MKELLDIIDKECDGAGLFEKDFDGETYFSVEFTFNDYAAASKFFERIMGDED